MYDLNIFKSKAYRIPILAVGNLSVGGTGKSPMIEYLLRLLKNEMEIATLSRGYKRETKGFQLVNTTSLAKDVGDEPLQFKQKFPNVMVAVDADRRNGIANLMKENPNLKGILLDDAYQHRKVKAGFYILLTAYYDLYTNDIMLPTGNLREPRQGAERANVIVVTKCPQNLSIEDQNGIRNQMKLIGNQSLFFSTIEYASNLRNDEHQLKIEELKRKGRFTLVTGIANPTPLLEYYDSLGLSYEHLNYPDHYHFTKTDLEELNSKETIVTTEKDYVRLASSLKQDCLWYQPIEIRFISEEDKFNQLIKEIM